MASGAAGKAGNFPEASPLNVIEEEEELAESQKHKPLLSLDGAKTKKLSKSPFSK
jgi:hypothetical protein